LRKLIPKNNAHVKDKTKPSIKARKGIEITLTALAKKWMMALRKWRFLFMIFSTPQLVVAGEIGGGALMI
jgi:hypothetical protein